MHPLVTTTLNDYSLTIFVYKCLVNLNNSQFSVEIEGLIRIATVHGNLLILKQFLNYIFKQTYDPKK